MSPAPREGFDEWELEPWADGALVLHRDPTVAAELLAQAMGGRVRGCQWARALLKAAS